MKKLISLTLAIMLILSLAVPALAADNETKVTGKIGGEGKTETYTLYIPAEASAGDFTKTTYATDAIKLTVANIKTTSKVEVSLSAATFVMTDSESKDTISCGVVFTTANAQTMELQDTNDEDTVTITPVKDDVNAASVGTYTGTITFTSKLVTAPSP